MKTIDTYHAPAEKKSDRSIIKEAKKVLEINYLNEIVNAMPNIAAIMNKERQILYYNTAFLNFSITDDNDLYGLRFGDTLNCINAKKMKGGCGTSENCRYCGAVNAILQSNTLNEEVTKECRISASNNEGSLSFDLKITANPFNFENNTYTIVGIEDISNEKRRRIIERIFFHDVINTAGGIQGFIGFLKDAHKEDEITEYISIVDRLSHDLVDEIQAQIALTAAENNELVINRNEISTYSLLEDVVNSLKFHQVAVGKILKIEKNTVNQSFISDEVILKRIIINMTKNALEASAEGMIITLGCDKKIGFLSFWVKNESYMPRSVQLQVFQRSFSTKGINRGLGTYSIKLLTEKFLKGKVMFTSTEEEGTRFYASIPNEK